MKHLLLIISVALIFVACNNDIDSEPTQREPGTLVQVSVIDALLQGIYDGYYPIGDLTTLGNYGIGTFHGLDGEMVVFNDTVFQVVSSGEVKMPAADVLTPFAAVTTFEADTSFQLSSTTFEEIKSNFDQYFPTPNLFYVIKIKGDFDYMRTRSVPKQEKPYLPLVEVTREQPEFEFENESGDIIGFYCPEFAKGINVTGMHIHFLNQERTGGGHIIEFQLKQGTMEIGYLMNYELILPEGGDFYGGDFTVDRSEDLEEAEN